MKKIILSLVFFSTLSIALGQDIKQYVLSSNNPKEVSNQELEFLKTEIGESQVVFLGEQDHGDGGAMLAKTVLAKYLVEEMGFSTIVFEGDFLTLNNSTLTLDQKWNKLFGIWKSSEQLIPLYELITTSDVELAGIDLNGTTGITDLKNIYWQKADELTVFTKEEISEAVHAIIFNTKAKKNSLKEVYRLTPLIIESTTGFEKQLIRSLQFVIDSYQQLPMRNRVGLEKYRERDTQMGHNLNWLMNNKLSGKKVIVWAANYHIANNPNEIESEKSWRFRSGQLESLGNKFDKLSKIKSYRIAVTSYGGKYTDWGYGSNSHIEIKPERHNENSLELLLSNQGTEYAFVPLNSIKMNFSLSGYAHKAYRGNWNKVYDAVFFMNKMTPSTYEQKKKVANNSYK
jgi:erythromycin esterase-like protein